MHCLLLLLIALGVPSAAAADADALDRYEGAWLRVETERDDAARHAAIDRATESMSFMFRGFARAVMRQRMQPVDEYVVEQSGETGVIRSNLGEEYPLDGQPRGGSEADTVISRVENGRIHQSWRHGAESYGDTYWNLGDSGERLVITERVHDAHFDGPIEFSTTYQRVEPQ